VAVKQQIDSDRFPEWQPFVEAVQQRRPDAGTWCEAWTVRDIVAHQAGNAEELARVLGAHLESEPVGTRNFEEREGPLRALNDADLWNALLDRMATLNEVAVAAEGVPADTDVAWTGRTIRCPGSPSTCAKNSSCTAGTSPETMLRLKRDWPSHG
jgi:hypothetical protein